MPTLDAASRLCFRLRTAGSISDMILFTLYSLRPYSTRPIAKALPSHPSHRTSSSSAVVDGGWLFARSTDSGAAFRSTKGFRNRVSCPSLERVKQSVLLHPADFPQLELRQSYTNARRRN